MQFEILNKELLEKEIIEVQAKENSLLPLLNFLYTKKFKKISKMVQEEFNNNQEWIVFETELEQEFGISSEDIIDYRDDNFWIKLVELAAILRAKDLGSIVTLRNEFKKNIPNSKTILSLIDQKGSFFQVQVAYTSKSIPEICWNDILSDSKSSIFIEVSLKLFLDFIPNSNFSLPLSKSILHFGLKNSNRHFDANFISKNQIVIKEKIMKEEVLVRPKIVLGSLSMNLKDFLALRVGMKIEIQNMVPIKGILELGGTQWMNIEINMNQNHLEIKIVENDDKNITSTDNFETN